MYLDQVFNRWNRIQGRGRQGFSYCRAATLSHQTTGMSTFSRTPQLRSRPWNKAVVRFWPGRSAKRTGHCYVRFGKHPNTAYRANSRETNESRLFDKVCQRSTLVPTLRTTELRPASFNSTSSVSASPARLTACTYSLSCYFALTILIIR